MPWTYHQRDGRLERNGIVVARGGYSGNGPAKNDPAAQSISMHGPIPVGQWTIGRMHDSATKGPYVMNLEPRPGTNTYHRTLFRIHGDSRRHPGEASDGCVVLPAAVRHAIGTSGDNVLVVVP